MGISESGCESGGAKALPRQILDALDAHTVVVPGTAAFGRVIFAEVLTSMPGLVFRTASKILTIVGDGAASPAAGHLAAYAGLAPVARRSGTSIKGETPSQRGNHALKSALFLSAFASLADPTSRAYYDRKGAQGKRHNAALICLARRRTDVIYASLRDCKPYQRSAPAEPAPHTADA
jgi:transposase